ncbi:MAG: hypothetical protein QW835_07000 [Candidatus Hadarchaeum sp.]
MEKWGIGILGVIIAVITMIAGAVILVGANVQMRESPPAAILGAPVALGSIRTEHIADHAITLSKLSPNVAERLLDIGSVDTFELAAGAVTIEKLSSDVKAWITEILPIDTTKIVNGAITTAKIADGTILDADISPNANIAGSKILAESITSAQLADDIMVESLSTKRILRTAENISIENAAITENLQVLGATTIGGTLDVADLLTASGGISSTTLTTSSTTTLGGNLNVTGATEIGGMLGVTGLTTISSLLMVNGGMVVGNGGTVIKKATVGTLSFNAGGGDSSVGASTTENNTATITGIATGDLLILVPPAALEDGLLYQGSTITSDNTVTIAIRNTTGAPISTTGQTWYYLWLDIT